MLCTGEVIASLKCTRHVKTCGVLMQNVVTMQAQVLMTELAAVVAAETANSTADYRLVANMNGLVQKQYAEMLTFVQSLQPQMQVSCFQLLVMLLIQ